jgi:hypothetical protein
LDCACQRNANATRRLLLRICSGRVVTQDTAAHPALTVDDVRSLSSSKLTASDSLHRALLLQNALGNISARAGTELFRDPEMNPWRLAQKQPQQQQHRRHVPAPLSPPAADPMPDSANNCNGKRPAAAHPPSPKARRLASFFGASPADAAKQAPACAAAAFL